MSARKNSLTFTKQFRGTAEKLVLESIFELNLDPLYYHGLYIPLYEHMIKRCPDPSQKNEAWERFMELVRATKDLCENSRETMRQRHGLESPSIYLGKSLNFAVNERGGVRIEADYTALTDTFLVILQDIRGQKLKLEGNDFFKLFQILNLFSYTEFNPAFKFFWKEFHSDGRKASQIIPKNSTVGSFQEAYELLEGENKRCFLCNKFKRKKVFKLKYLKQHMTSYHAIYSYGCDWDGCKQTFSAWRYLTSHKQNFHLLNQQAEGEKEDKENDGDNEINNGKRKKNAPKTVSKKICDRTPLDAANQTLEITESCLGSSTSVAASPVIMTEETSSIIRIVNLDPNVLHSTCEKVIKDLCAIIESYDSSVSVTAPFTYDASTGVLDRKVQLKSKLEAPINPVLSTCEEYVPGLSDVQQEMELE